MSAGRSIPAFCEDLTEADIPIWREVLFAAELVLLHSSPVYWGFHVPQGDGSAVVLIPGFLKDDGYLSHLHAWLTRIGYRPYFSGIGQNAECPNLLIESAVRDSVARAYRESGRKIHIIGHSLGGLIARAVAAQQPESVASVITLASPFRGTVAHRLILSAAEQVRKRILEENGPKVLPTCYTGRCTCEFLQALRQDVPESVMETAIFTRSDGIVDWRYCRTEKSGDRLRSSRHAPWTGFQLGGIFDHCDPVENCSSGLGPGSFPFPLRASQHPPPFSQNGKR